MIRFPFTLYRELKAQILFHKRHHEIGDSLRRFRRSSQKKPLFTILRELLRVTRQYRSIPDHYFRYNLYKPEIPTERVCDYVSSYILDMKWFPVINNHFKHHPLLLNNKIFFKQFLRQYGFPVSEPYVYIMNKTFYTPQMEKISIHEALARLESSGANRLFCKSDILDRATGITCFDSTNGSAPYQSGSTRLDIPFLEYLTMTGGYLFERGVEQHPVMSQLNPSSLNTFRIVTQYQSGTDSNVLWSILRMGSGDSPFDNVISGGMFVLIDPLTGAVISDGYNKKLVTTASHPVSGIRFDELELPFFSEIAELACRAADVFPTLPSIGWDIGYTEQGPVIIEGNDRWGSDPYQIAVGGIAPLLLKEWFNGGPAPR